MCSQYTLSSARFQSLFFVSRSFVVYNLYAVLHRIKCSTCAQWNAPQNTQFGGEPTEMFHSSRFCLRDARAVVSICAAAEMSDIQWAMSGDALLFLRVVKLSENVQISLIP